jgi:hypothetical protein
MKRFTMVALATLSILLFVSQGSMLAADEMSMLSYKGDLVQVSSDSHMLTVRGTDQKEWEFTYNDNTEVTGDIETVEGLAGKTGTPITVYYKSEGNKHIATRIEVRQKQAPHSESAPLY